MGKYFVKIYYIATIKKQKAKMNNNWYVFVFFL